MMIKICLMLLNKHLKSKTVDNTLLNKFKIHAFENIILDTLRLSYQSDNGFQKMNEIVDNIYFMICH